MGLWSCSKTGMPDVLRATRFTNDLTDKEVRQSNLLLWLWCNILSNQRWTTLTGNSSRATSYFTRQNCGWADASSWTPTVRFKKKTFTFLFSAGCLGNWADMAAELTKGVEQVSVGKQEIRIAGAGKLVSKLAFHVCPEYCIICCDDSQLAP